MANKRQLKKAIRYACGEMAGECIFASETIEGTEIEKWDNIILDIAMLQEEAVNSIAAKFDKKPKDFETAKAYKDARRAYFKKAEKELSEYMHKETEKIVEAMNALVPKTKNA